jgi:hypothetical protein
LEGKSPLGSRETKHSAVAVETIKGHLVAGDPTEAWCSLGGWYKAATDHTQKANKMSLAVQTAKCIALLNEKVVSKEDPFPIQVNKADILDNTPSDGKLQAVMREIWNRRIVGVTGLHSEHIKL